MEANNKQKLTAKEKTIKFSKKWSPLFLTVAAVSATIGGFVYAGYQSMANGTYDVTVAISSRDNLNYITGTGKTTRATKSMVSGWTTNSLTDQAAINLLNNTEAWDLENPEVKKYYDTLVLLTQENGAVDINDTTDPTHDLETYKIVTTGLENPFSTQDQLETGATLGAYPFTIIEDLIDELYFSTSPITYTPTTGSPDGAHNSQIRIYLDEGHKWKSSSEEGSDDEIVIEDFVYGTMVTGTTIHGASQKYMLKSEYSGITGMDAWFDFQDTKTDVNGDGIYDHDDSYEYFREYVSWNVDDKTVTKPQAGIWYSPSEGWIQYNFISPNNAQYFLGMMHSSAFQPLNESFIEESKQLDGKLSQYGYSPDLMSTYGPLYITSFDPDYGIEAKKNPNWKYADAVVAEDFLFRVVTEPSTAVSSFNQGKISHIYGAELTSPLYLEDENTALWNNMSYQAPTSKMILYNLDPTISTPSSKYYKNPNFRRAVSHSYNRNTYYEFINNPAASASKQAAPDRVGIYNADVNGDGTKESYVMEDILADQYYTVQKENGETVDVLLGAYTSAEKTAFLSEGRPEGDDPFMNQSLAIYYYGEFLEDMEAIGEPMKRGANNELVGVDTEFSGDQIVVEYITTKGQDDEIVKSLNQSLEAAFNTEEGKKYQVNGVNNSSAPIYIMPVKTTDVNGDWANQRYEMTAISWNPDYMTPWASQGIFTSTDLERQANLAAGWNFWTGSEYVYGVNPNGEANDVYTYSSSQANGIASWEKDGILSIEDSTVATIIPASYIVTDTTGQEQTINLNSYWATLEAFANSNVVIDPNAQFINTNGKEVTYTQVTGPGQMQFDQLDPVENLAYGIIFEIIFSWAAPTIVYANAMPEINPSRLTFQTNPSVGYTIFGATYDCDFPPIKGLPTAEDVLEARGVTSN